MIAAGRAKLLLIGVVLAAMPLAMLYPLWTNPVSANEDDVVYYRPLRTLVAEQVAEGRLPARNPREATGEPLMADPQSAVMHPLTWMFFVLDVNTAYALSIFAAFAAAGVGTFTYLRQVGLVHPGAMIGAIAMMFCGFFVGHRVHLSMIVTAAMLPWGLWCIERLGAASGRGRLAALLGPVAASTAVLYFAISAGHFPILIYMGVAWAAYLLIRGRPLLPTVIGASVALLLAAAITAPQLAASAELLMATTRQRIGYATAGENSFMPISAVLALFPMLMGSRTPNFYPQSWWGPWHLCEMLGYVGLVTLVLAAAAVWRLYRRRTDAAAGESTSLVRTWTWIGAGAGVWMLGYYLPTYRLIHAIPVLGVVRCPARMLLVADMALATLAAVGVHVAITGRPQRRVRRLARTTRRGALVYLPAAMILTLLTVAGLGALLRAFWADKLPNPFVGGAEDMLSAVWPGSAAVWVPLATAGATAACVAVWLARPRRRWGLLAGLLVIDLFFVARFVDVPGDNSLRRTDASPAATWLAEHDPDGSYLVWGLADSYHDRASELLLPKACEATGFATISGYGPFQSPAHARLLGFTVHGHNRDWRSLVRRNHLLSLYGVRYLLASHAEHRQVIESVRVAEARPADGENLLHDGWETSRADVTGDTLRLRAPALWLPASAKQYVELTGGRVCRIALNARGPDGGAANTLRAEFLPHPGPADGETAMIVAPEQITSEWRHFEWTFRVPGGGDVSGTFKLSTMSERPIEVRDFSLRASDWERPVVLGDAVAPGERVYVRRAELPPALSGRRGVAIYENRLAWPASDPAGRPAPTHERIEMLRWRPAEYLVSHDAPPDLRIRTSVRPGGLMPAWTLPAAGAWAVMVAAAAAAARRDARRRKVSRR